MSNPFQPQEATVPQSVVDMQNIAQYNWQQKAKAAVTALAAAIGAVSGLLIGPITTVYYDSGFLVGLKGFVGAIVGGLASYPVAAAGAIFVGLVEAFSSFWASAYKEVIVFTLILPVLLWRSFTTTHHEEE